MASHTRYHKTVFLPGLYGQYKLWRSEIAGYCNRADKVIQFGNVIGCNDYVKDKEHFGANESLLKYIILYRATEENWLQLAGPNEIAALNLPEEWTNKRSRQVLRNSWFSDDPTMFVAGVHEGKLVTHGGLTYGEWLSIGSPEDAETASERLNNKYVGTLHQGGCLSLGGAANYSANPIWADPVLEMYPSWLSAPVPMPFSQIHSGNTLNSKLGHSAINADFSLYEYADSILYRKYGSHFTKDGEEILGINVPLEGGIITQIPEPHAIYVEKKVV